MTEERRRQATERMRRWRAANRERARASCRASLRRLNADPAKKERRAASKRAAHLEKKNPERLERRRLHDRERSVEKRKDPAQVAKLRAAYRKSKYGVTAEQFDKQLVAQSHLCANRACGASIDRSAHLDHDHDTGALRGILCRQCNTLEGTLRRQAKRVEGLEAYLKAGSVWGATR